MFPFSLPATASSPAVELNPISGVFRISGESYPSNSYEFYRPIIDWITAFLDEHDAAKLEVELSYLNTSSTKCMLDILELLEHQYKQGKQVAVTWFYDPENHRALELVEEFNEDLTLPFHIKAR